MRARAAALLLFSISPAFARPKHEDPYEKMNQAAQVIKKIDQEAKQPHLTPQRREELRQTRAENLDVVDQAANTDLKDPLIQSRALGVFMGANEPARALPRAERVVDLAPGNPQAYVMRGQVRRALNDYRGAEKDAQQALKINPNDRDAQMLLALTQGRGNFEAGAPAAGQGGASAGGSAGARPEASAAAAPMAAAAQLQRSVQPPSAAVVQAIVAEGSANADRLKAFDLFKQAQAKASLGDDAAAKGLLDKAVAADPRNAQLFAARAQARVRTGDAAGGLADANAALVLDGRSARAYLARAAAHEALGEPLASSLSDYKLAAELDPDLAGDVQQALARRGGGAPADARAQRSQAAAQDQWGALPEDARKALPFALLGLGLLVAAGGALWLRRDSNPS